MSPNPVFEQTKNAVYEELKSHDGESHPVSDMAVDLKIPLESVLDALASLRLEGKAQQTNNGWVAI